MRVPTDRIKNDASIIKKKFFYYRKCIFSSVLSIENMDASVDLYGHLAARRTSL